MYITFGVLLSILEMERKTTCVQQDREQFPGASVSRVGTKRWSAQDDKALGRIYRKIESYLRCHADAPFEETLRGFLQHDFRVKVGRDQFAHILCGSPPLFLSDEGELNMDVRGLVYKPIARRIGDAMLLELGGDI